MTIAIGESPAVHHEILPYIHTLLELEYLSRFIIDLSQLIRKYSSHRRIAFCGFVFSDLVGEETSFSSKLKSSHVMIVVWIWLMAFNSTTTHTSVHNVTADSTPVSGRLRSYVCCPFHMFDIPLAFFLPLFQCCWPNKISWGRDGQ